MFVRGGWVAAPSRTPMPSGIEKSVGIRNSSLGVCELMCKPCETRKCSVTGLVLPAGMLTCSGNRYCTASVVIGDWFRGELEMNCPGAFAIASTASARDTQICFFDRFIILNLCCSLIAGKLLITDL